MNSTMRLGAFILVAGAMFTAAAFLVGKQQTRFMSKYRLASEFQTVAGLDEGSEVRVGGIHKGTVRSIQLPSRPDGKITIHMDMEKDTQSIIRQDSMASIQTEGLLGDKYVEVSFGTPEAEKVRDGSKIASKPPLDLADIFDKANGIMDTTQKSMEHIQEVSENVNLITSKINAGQGTLGKLVNDRTLYQEAAAGVSSLHENAEAMKRNFLLRGFFKDRGYNDRDEVKKHLVAKMPTGAPAQRYTFDVKKLFDEPDSAKLDNEKLLDPAGQFLQSNRFDSAVIVAAMGMTGDTEKQKLLTEARSYVVRKYLVEHFRTQDTRIKTYGLGKQANVPGEGTLELLIYGTGAKPAR